VLIAGSSAEYAEPADGAPIAEGAPTEPNSPYASSKLAADQLSQLYFRRFALDVVRFRPFYLIGPRKTGDVSSDFARRVVAIERGEESVMRVGALDVVRDIIDVRDGVDAVLSIAGSGKSGELYNICGGTGVSIGDILDTYRKLARVPIEVTSDPNLMRALEQRVKIGDSSKLRALGWMPHHSLTDSLCAILDHWRKAPA
jgi:nucleoside-diphosphate-sugar epimerase